MSATSIVVMGVAGCGKSTFGRALALRLGLSFVDADDYHPPRNVEKMAAGIPLTDVDRAGWLDALVAKLQSAERDGAPIVLACSALKARYRQRLASDISSLFLLYLRISPELARQRLRQRTGHFMPESLVISQFEALEEPQVALTLDAQLSTEVLVAQALDGLPAAAIHAGSR